MVESRRIKLTIEYDGTDFVGWQSQQNGRAVQDVLENAASSLLQEPVRINGAGRTDAGVHARGYVAHFDTNSSLDLSTIHRGLNALLPEDITVHQMAEVDKNFHARFSASSRSYSYTISRRRISLDRKYVWILYYELDEDKIQQAVRLIRGTHDFTSFSKYSNDVEHCYCHVFDAQWDSLDDSFNFTIRSNRFLFGMVRIIVGTLVDVGRGKISLDEFKETFEKKERSALFTVAPVQGLVLESVRYDKNEYELVKKILEELKK